MHLSIALVLGLTTGGLGLILARSIGVVYLLGFPGILAHELAHFLIAWVLCAEPSPIRLFPIKDEEGGWALGSVDFTPAWWSAGLVALAPLYLLTPAAFLLVALASQWSAPWQAVAGFVTAGIAWNAWPSSKDWIIAARYPLGTLLLLGGAAFMFLQVLHGKG